MKKILIISFNAVILVVSLVVYFNNKGDFFEIASRYNKIDAGFKDINDAYYDSLGRISEHLDTTVSRQMLQKISNDSLVIYLVKQKSLGQYYRNYQDAIRTEVSDLSQGIAQQQNAQKVLLVIIIASCLINIGLQVLAKE